MKKNYILKKQLIITLLLLLSVHFWSIAQSRSSLLNGGKQFPNTISSSSTIQNLSNVTRQSSNVTPSVYAVCNLDQGAFDFPDSTGNTTFGQSFTAQCNSNIASVSLTIGGTVPSTPITANVYLGETLSGPSLGNATLAIGITGENVFIFSAPIPITSGQIYSVIFTSSTILSVPYSISDPYADGNAADGSGFQTGVDLVFKITTCDTPITPTFTAVAAVCTGETLAALPTTSNNGITGIWSPALNNLATTTYTFTPDVLQCASTTTLTITVNPSTVNTTTVSVCDTYTWPYNGTTYTTSGIYIEPVPIVNGIVNDLTLWNTAATEGAATVSSSNLDGYPGQYAAGLALTIGGVNVNINAPGGIFNDANQIGTDFPDSPMTISFSPAIYGVSGNFYFTDLSFNPVPGNITVTYSDGTVDTAAVSSPSDFFGYFTTGLISSVTISPTTNQGIWVTLDNLNITTNPTGCNKETLNLTVTPSTTNTTTISACDSYTWSANSTTYTSSGTYTFISNCGTNTLNLTIIPTTTNSTTVSVCDTYTWSVNSTTYTTSGIYTAVIGCLTETLNLTITPSTTTGSVTTSICAGNSYTWPANGTTYTTEQLGVTVITGCNTATLNLTITPLTTIGSVTTSICEGDSYTWPANGTTYTTAQSGITVVTGCNTATLNLSITPLTTTGSVTTSICAGDSYTWPANGTTYTTAQSGITVVTGCNTATLNLSITPLTTTGSVTTSICAGDSYTWPANGTTYTTSQSGITVVTGCNTATLNLTVNPLTTTGSVTTSICAGDSYTWPANGTTYTTSQSGITVVTGCNTAILNLTVNPLTTTGSVTTSICTGDSYTWPANGTTYTTSQSGITVVTGCNTATLNLTVNPLTTTGSVTTSICAGDSYTWPANGTTYTTSQSGITVVTGCNTATLNLTVNPLTTTGSVTTSICAGDSYTWPANGTTYTTSQSGITVVTGCNTATLNLTVNPLTTTGSVTTSICAGDSYTWPANGTTYTTSQSGITVVTGCNTATLNLTINTASTPTGSTTQTLNVPNASDATIASLIVSPTNVIWYASLADAQAGTNALLSTTVLTTGATYWAVNVAGSCSSTPFAVTVTVALSFEVFDDVSFIFYPNPTSSILNIKYSKEISGISIFNLLGQLIMEKQTNSTEVQIDLLNLPSATYFVKVTSEDVEKIIKVIKK